MNRNWDANLKLGHYLILFLICECFLVFICIIILHFCFKSPKSSCHPSLQKYSPLLSILYTAIRARWDNSLIVPHSSTWKARLPLSKSPPSFPGSSLCNHSWLKSSLGLLTCVITVTPLNLPHCILLWNCTHISSLWVQLSAHFLLLPFEMRFYTLEISFDP